MKSLFHTQPLTWPLVAWLSAGLAGVAGPAVALVLLGTASAPAPAAFAVVGGPILAVGLMGTGMIAASAAGRFWTGVLLALLGGAGLVLLARVLGMASLAHPFSTMVAILVASISFAARGALFARSAAGKGWWIAVFVVAGEAAMLITALVLPGALPDWLLVLLPAQWANMAIQTAFAGHGTFAASSALIALGGTAAATLMVAGLWPRRWPYLVMFTAWLALSALVWHRPVSPLSSAHSTVAAAPNLAERADN